MEVRILVADALLQGPHCLLRADRFGADDIGDLQVEGDILTVSCQSWAGACPDGQGDAHRELEVALSICSSSCDVDANHPATFMVDCESLGPTGGMLR